MPPTKKILNELLIYHTHSYGLCGLAKLDTAQSKHDKCDVGGHIDCRSSTGNIRQHTALNIFF